MSLKKEIAKYFVAIVPPTPVYEEAMALKNYFKEKYNSKASLNSPPHITLHMPFEFKVSKETQLISTLDTFCKRFDPIKLCIDNFSSFPPRVIFLNVIDNESLHALQKDLQRFFKLNLNLFNANYKEHRFHPHLTLAFRDLKKSAYKDAWSEFENKEFKAEFIADKITLLKHDGNVWKVKQEFTLTSSYSTDVAKELETTEG
jgi:2'-5' RNA ligase